MKEAKNTEYLSKKVAANEKSLENLGVKLEGLTTAVKSQLSFNKMLETQLSQLAAALPSSEARESVSAVTTRGGKSTRDPPFPLHAEKEKAAEKGSSSPTDQQPNETVPPGGTTTNELFDSDILLFPQRHWKPSMDEQFARFVVRQVD